MTDFEGYSTNRNWTKEEDKYLIESVHYSNRNWRKISQKLGTKTPQQCSYRYSKLISGMNNKKWTRNEDILLIELTETYGHNWQIISQNLPERTSEEIQERFEKKLDPNLKRCKFEKEEDELIISLYEKYGNKWNEIAKFFKDRNSSMIKNRYYSFLKKKYNDNNCKINNITHSESMGITISETSSINSNKNCVNQLETYSKNFNNNVLCNTKNILNIKSDGRKTVSYNDSIKLQNFRETAQKEEIENFLFMNNKNSALYNQNNLIDNNLEYVNNISLRELENHFNIQNSELNVDNMFNFNMEISPKSKIIMNANNFVNNNFISKTQGEINQPMLIDEPNFIKESDSPKIQKNGDENLHEFNKYYNNVFDNKSIKSNFEEQNIDHNENLFQQYKMLEDTFQRIFEISNLKLKSFNESKNNIYNI